MIRALLAPISAAVVLAGLWLTGGVLSVTAVAVATMVLVGGYLALGTLRDKTVDEAIAAGTAELGGSSSSPISDGGGLVPRLLGVLRFRPVALVSDGRRRRPF